MHYVHGKNGSTKIIFYLTQVFVPHAHLGTIWYHSKPSDVPYSPHPFLGWDFFRPFLKKDSSSSIFVLHNLLQKGVRACLKQQFVKNQSSA